MVHGHFKTRTQNCSQCVSKEIASTAPLPARKFPSGSGARRFGGVECNSLRVEGEKGAEVKEKTAGGPHGPTNP